MDIKCNLNIRKATALRAEKNSGRETQARSVDDFFMINEDVPDVEDLCK